MHHYCSACNVPLSIISTTLFKFFSLHFSRRAQMAGQGFIIKGLCIFHSNIWYQSTKLLDFWKDPKTYEQAASCCQNYPADTKFLNTNPDSKRFTSRLLSLKRPFSKIWISSDLSCYQITQLMSEWQCADLISISWPQTKRAIFLLGFKAFA